MNKNNRCHTIMIADDEEKILDIYARALTCAGHDVVLAQDGQEVLKKLKSAGAPPLDLILLDIIMPKLDGFDTLKKIKKIEKYKDTPVVMLTNLDRPKDKYEAKKLGATDYWVKLGVTPKELVEKVADI